MEEASWVPETELDTTDCIPHSQSTAQTVREREGWEGCLGSKAQVAGGMSSSGVTLGVQECIKHIQVIYSLQRGQSWNKELESIPPVHQRLTHLSISFSLV